MLDDEVGKNIDCFLDNDDNNVVVFDVWIVIMIIINL